MRAGIAFQQGDGDRQRRIGAFVSHAAYAAAETAVAIVAMFLSELPRMITGL